MASRLTQRSFGACLTFSTSICFLLLLTHLSCSHLSIFFFALSFPIISSGFLIRQKSNGTSSDPVRSVEEKEWNTRTIFPFGWSQQPQISVLIDSYSTLAGRKTPKNKIKEWILNCEIDGRKRIEEVGGLLWHVIATGFTSVRSGRVNAVFCVSRSTSTSSCAWVFCSSS